MPTNYSNPVGGQINPDSGKEVAQSHVNAYDSHGGREGRCKAIVANTISLDSTTDQNTHLYQQNSAEEGATADGILDEPITPKEECEKISEHTHQPLIFPKP